MEKGLSAGAGGFIATWHRSGSSGIDYTCSNGMVYPLAMRLGYVRPKGSTEKKV